MAKKYVTAEELEARPDKCLRDGEVYRVPRFTMMDSNSLPVLTVIDREYGNQTTPNPYARTLPLSDSEFLRRSNQIDAKNKALSRAWQDIPSAEAAKPPLTGDMWEARDRRLENAWRGGA